MNLAQQVQENLAQMEEALLSDTPNIATLLRTIHQQLKKDPEIVTILSEEECGILVSGLKEHTAIEISTKALKKTGTKSLKATTTDDL